MWPMILDHVDSARQPSHLMRRKMRKQTRYTQRANQTKDVTAISTYTGDKRKQIVSTKQFAALIRGVCGSFSWPLCFIRQFYGFFLSRIRCHSIRRNCEKFTRVARSICGRFCTHIWRIMSESFRPIGVFRVGLQFTTFCISTQATHRSYEVIADTARTQNNCNASQLTTCKYIATVRGIDFHR